MRIAYYVSGHGYGHATRVSAFATHLLASNASVYLVSSAPAHVFAEAIGHGAHYRNADIDPVIVQPLAYRIDRPKSVRVLQRFIERMDQKAQLEAEWLTANAIDCVITDAACLACLAASTASIPSILCTNFTFDSIFSFLSTHYVDQSSSLEPLSPDEMTQDLPVPVHELDPLVQRLADAYAKASLMLLLPGAIPIPAFMDFAPLPSPAWVKPSNSHFIPVITEALLEAQLPKPLETSKSERQVVPTPLLVRETSSDVFSSAEARTKTLRYASVPDEFHGHKILVVSFGGQRIVAPRSVTSSAHGSRSGSPAPSSPEKRGTTLPPIPAPDIHPVQPVRPAEDAGSVARDLAQATEQLHVQLSLSSTGSNDTIKPKSLLMPPQTPGARVATPSHIYVPGAPAGAAHTSPRPAQDGFGQPPQRTTSLEDGITIEVSEAPQPTVEDVDNGKSEPRLLPDESWIAVVCGAGDAWGHEHLPDRFFVAPKDVYMPDLTAVSDCYLGKLGYSTCAECVDSATPFVFVPRPLFVEEVGLRILLEKRGVGVQMSREQYESGDWATAIEEAYERGRTLKAKRRAKGVDTQRQQDTRELAEQVLQWISHRTGRDSPSAA